MRRRYWATIEDINRILQVTNIVDPQYPNVVPIEGVRVAKVNAENALIETTVKIGGAVIDTPLTFASGSVANPSIKMMRTGGVANSGLYYTSGVGIGVSANGQRVGEIGANGLGAIGFTNDAHEIDFHNASVVNACYGTNAYLYAISNPGSLLMSDVSAILIRIPMKPASNKSIVLSIKLEIIISNDAIAQSRSVMSAQFIAYKNNGSSNTTVSIPFNQSMRGFYLTFGDIISIVGGVNEILISKKGWQLTDDDGAIIPPVQTMWTPYCEIQRIDY